MRKNKILLISILFVLMVAAPFYILGCGKSGAAGEAGKSGKALYRCPMHPTYVSDKPGDCPICNMKLVKIEKAPEEKPSAKKSAAKVEPAKEKSAEEVCVEHKCTMKNCQMDVRTMLKPGERAICPICGEVISTTSGKVVEIMKHPSHEAAGPTVMISPERQQLIGVETQDIAKRRLLKVIRAEGKIAYDPELVVTQEEFIQALNNEDNVKDSPLKDVAERARSMTDAARKKLKLLGMSDEQIDDLKKTRKVDTSLYLPAKGEAVWAYISIYEYEIGPVKVGDDVEVEATAYPGEKFYGKVVSINPVLDPMTRTNQVRVKVENPDDKLKPEMFVNGRIKIDLGEKLAVPESAVLDTGLRKIVYLSKENDMLESREVATGQKAEGYYEVVDGLSEGDMVVTSGNFLIDSESKLKSASQSAEHKHE